MNPKTYILRPQPPMRAFALAAGLSMLGAILVVICAATHAHTAFMVISVIVLALGVLLLVAGLISMRRLRSYVDLTDDGYTVRTPGRTRSGAWDDVTKVTTSQEGAHLTLYQGQVGRTHILAPGNVASAEMLALGEDIASRLDQNRGYRTLSEDDFAASPVEVSTAPQQPDAEAVALDETEVEETDDVDEVRQAQARQ